jgi:alkanesulfonate monooxygenase SsuD/methylene tetrahydromethanopterin reductase-like flavin-dependent oxidoreductase (luciferase family)
MQIGIGLPNMIPGTPAPDVLEWARRTDAGKFSTLATLDRLVYPNYEALMTLAAAAGVTTRVRLMTTVLIAPIRNAALLAKQAATLDALSSGRLTLGLGVGGREDDYEVAGEPFHARGSRFEEQLSLMRQTWAGESSLPIGPSPIRAKGPEVLIGGRGEAAVRRAAQWDGYIAGAGSGAESAGQLYGLVQQAWQEAGRQGKPRLVCTAYFALGPGAVERGGAYLTGYYAYMGLRAEQIVEGMVSTAEDLRSTRDRYQAIGADELILWPCVADLDQLDLVVDALR